MPSTRAGTNSGARMLDTVFVLSLLCVLTAVSLMLVSTGASLYQNIAADMDRSFQLNTSLTYVANKVRGGDMAGQVYIEDFYGQEALVLGESYDEYQYATWIYCYEGQLMELFGEVGGEYELTDGTPLLELQDFQFTMDGRILHMKAIAKDGSYENLSLSLRSSAKPMAAGIQTPEANLDIANDTTAPPTYPSDTPMAEQDLAGGDGGG